MCGTGAAGTGRAAGQPRGNTACAGPTVRSTALFICRLAGSCFFSNLCVLFLFVSIFSSLVSLPFFTAHC